MYIYGYNQCVFQVSLGCKVLVNKMPLGDLKAEQTNLPTRQLYFMSLYGKLDIAARLGAKCTSGLTQAET